MPLNLVYHSYLVSISNKRLFFHTDNGHCWATFSLSFCLKGFHRGLIIIIREQPLLQIMHLCIFLKLRKRQSEMVLWAKSETQILCLVKRLYQILHIYLKNIIFKVYNANNMPWAANGLYSWWISTRNVSAFVHAVRCKLFRQTLIQAMFPKCCSIS